MDARRPLHRFLVPALAALVLAACGDSADTQTQPEVKYDVDNPRPYTGPADASADVTAFRKFLWQNISGDDRCGEGASAENQQAAAFAPALLDLGEGGPVRFVRARGARRPKRRRG